MSNDLQTTWAQCADRLQRSSSDKIGCDASPTIGWSPSGSRHSILIPGSAGSALTVRSPFIADGDINLQQSRLGVQQGVLGMDARWPLTNSASSAQGFARREKDDEAHTSTRAKTGTNKAWQKIAELKSDHLTAQREHAELHAECRALRAENAALVADVRAWDDACRFMTAEGDALKAENKMLQSTRDDLQVEVINTKVILAKVTAERDLLNAKVNAAQARLAKEAAFTEKRVADTLQQELDTLRKAHADLQQQHNLMESEHARARASAEGRGEDLDKNRSRMQGQRAMLEAEIVSADAAGTMNAHQHPKLVERCETLHREMEAKEVTMKLMQSAHSEVNRQACAMDSVQAQILETLDKLHLQLQMAHSELILSPSARIQLLQDKFQNEQLMFSHACEQSMDPNQTQYAAVKNHRMIEILQHVMPVKEPKETHHRDGNRELSLKGHPSALLRRPDALGHFSSLAWWLPAPDTETVGNRDGKTEFKIAQAHTDLNDSCHSGTRASQSSEVIVEFTDQFLGLNIREVNDLCVEVAAISQKCALASVLDGNEMRPGIGDRVSSVNGVRCRGLDFKAVSALIGEFGS